MPLSHHRVHPQRPGVHARADLVTHRAQQAVRKLDERGVGDTCAEVYGDAYCVK